LNSTILIALIALAWVIAIAIAIIIAPRQRKKTRQERLDKIEAIAPEVEAALNDVSEYFSYSHYITESERKGLVDKYTYLYKDVRRILSFKELASSSHNECFHRFYSALHESQSHKKANNRHFIENQLSQYASYFDTVLAYPLDPQQREAVVSLEDNVLVISSAGSGKTMTTVGKVRYLIDIQKVDPSKILLITFTRKAAESLSERLGEKDLKCRTFHKLALDIISEATGEKPTLVSEDFAVQVYHKLFNENDSFHQAIADHIIRARYKMKSQFEYDSRQEYMQDRLRYGIQSFFNDMDNRPVFCKSDEESKICDFLGARGIKFRYEQKYEHNTVDKDYRQYCPDFSLFITADDGSTKRIYLEHFAVNEKGHCPKFFTQDEEQAYMEGIQWKRQLHKEKGTILLETTSADFHRGDVFRKLTGQLLEQGVVFRKYEPDSVSRELAKQEESILNMLTAFNFLLKSRDASEQDIYRKADDEDRITLNEIVFPFVKGYRQMEADLHEIDFTDAIIRATNLCNNGHRPDYDYILVDEFQDISLDRYHFLQALRRPHPLTKLFCVGDDWQSIYRFAGSDMALFKHFDEYFGYTKKCLMETTYRFGEPVIEKSSKFILANPEQAIKNVRSFKVDAETNIDFYSTQDWNSVAETVKAIADTIPVDKEIMLLGRYGFDVNVFKNSDLTISESKDHTYVKYGKRKMPFLTVHKSKGLESDYIILLNCNGGAMGFPADVSDSPVLKYVLSEPDAYAYSEERRIFYVGITRAKKHTWVLYDMNNPSPFVKEFIGQSDTNFNPNGNIPSDELCPRCRCGRVKVAKRGIAVNGNPYSVMVCSNRKYGCDYLETRFVNLNERRKNSH
jgi:DNA helicase-4